MRDRMERFVVLPFSVGCISDSSVAVAAALSPSPRRSSKHDSDSSPQENPEDDEENMKNNFKFFALSKPEMPGTTGIHRLFKNFKTISHLFAYKEEMDEEYEASGMEIGFPTDVKHVSHIGWEGPVTTAAKSGEGFEHLIPPELLPHHHHQLQLHHHLTPPTAQDHHLHSPLLINPST